MKKLSPHPIKFQGLNANERIELFLRRHPIVLWKKIGLLFLAGLVPVVLWIGLLTQTSALNDDTSTLYIVIVLVLSLFYLFWARGIFTSWLDYYLDVWVVTNERIMNIEQKGMFNRKIAEQMLSRIQDVTTHTKGFWGTTLHYGDIFVQTAAETTEFIYRDIAHPEIVAQEISRLQKQAIILEQESLRAAPPLSAEQQTPQTATPPPTA